MKSNPMIKPRAIMLLLPVAILASYNTFSQCGAVPISGEEKIKQNTIVNSYYPATADASAGAYSLTVGSLDARGSSEVIAAGDLIVIMQMQGADINTTNNDAYGDGMSGGAASGALTNSDMIAGYYEYASVTGFSGGTIQLMYALARSYYNRPFTSSQGIRRFQIIRVPRYYDLTINKNRSVTAPPWNGTSGGVVVLDAVNKLTIKGSVLASGIGFRGGGGKMFTGAGAGNTNGSGVLTNTDYRWNTPVTTAANTSGGTKGEGVAGAPPYTYTLGNTTTTTSSSLEGYINGALGRGAPANAGGGGTDGIPVGSSNNQYNSGGGGGGNGGDGGKGGSGWHGGSGSVASFPMGGFGGSAYPNNALQQIIMGGGGGAGTANNSDAANEVNSSGGPGGGIILIRAKSYAGDGTVNADGADAPGVTKSYSTAQTDAAGGGGAGGTIVIVTTEAGATGLDDISASAKGGKGGDVTTYYDHGPGGGGGGGVIYTNGVLASADVSAGANGLTRTGSPSGPVDNPYGATVGGHGSAVTLPGAPVLTNADGLTMLCGILPVTFKSFTASAGSTGVDLAWQEDNSLPFHHYEIEHGVSGESFTRIGSLPYISGSHPYTFIHFWPAAGKNYYRLKKIAENGKYSYSQIIMAQLPEVPTVNSGKIRLYPNPVTSATVLRYEAASRQWITIEVFSSTGKSVIHKKQLTEKGRNLIPLPEAIALPAGVYLIQINTGSGNIMDKLVVRRQEP